MKKITTGTFQILFTILIFMNANLIFAQSAPQGFNYQAIARDASNIELNNQLVGIKIGIYSGSATGTLEWEETHSVTTNQFGLFTLTIGQGISTGAGSVTSFSLINWGAAAHYMKVAMDITGGTSYTVMDNSQLLSVPYALFSQKSSLVSSISLNDLTDADTTGISVGKTLKWNGLNWIPSNDNDSDTALYAYNANHSTYSDTANYSLHCPPADTANYAFTADSSSFATNSANATNANHSTYSDTTTYALNCANTTNDWHLTGNTGTNAAINFLGTTDAVDLVVKTNNQERMRITSLGKIGVGTSAPIATLHIIGNDGLIEKGTFGSGTIPATGAGTRMMWYPKKAAFRAGAVTGIAWDDAGIGNYSFATGYNAKASGHFAVALGQATIASDSNAVAMGWTCTASGANSVALGNGAIAFGKASVAIGRGAQANGFASVAIGYHNGASGSYAVAIGDHNLANADNSTALGYYCSTNGKTGTFIWCDASTLLTTTNATANNQFFVKASGGTFFYSNSTMTSGVSLAPGGGAWASVSDRRMKENFQTVDGNEILKKIAEMPVTSWNYKTQSADIRHIGPMAQDFYKSFGFGESDTTITSVDIDGINMAAVKALIEKTNELNEKAQEIDQLKATIKQLKANNDRLEGRVESMEKAVERNTKLFSLAPEKK
ncbi:MAG: tail fiber domain-containing protein [Bacteroidia bacterium]